MISKGIFSVLTTFYPAVREYEKLHPDQKREPEDADKEELERELKLLKPCFKEIT